MDYLKLDPAIDTDPEIEEAGWCAARVYELLLKVSALKDLHGRLSPEHQRTAWLARRWNLTDGDLPGIKPEAFIEGGIKRLLEKRKLHREGADLVITAWDKFYRPAKSVGDRVADHRAKKRLAEDGNGAEEPPLHVTTVTDGNGVTNVTLPTHPPTHVTNETFPRARAGQGEDIPKASPKAQDPVQKALADAVTPITAAARKSTLPQPRPDASGMLDERVCAIFLEERGVAYVWDHRRDGGAWRTLLEYVQDLDPPAQVAEICRRWRNGLRRKFPPLNALSELARHDRWNACATAEPTSGKPDNSDLPALVDTNGNEAWGTADDLRRRWKAGELRPATEVAQ